MATKPQEHTYLITRLMPSGEIRRGEPFTLPRRKALLAYATHLRSISMYQRGHQPSFMVLLEDGQKLRGDRIENGRIYQEPIKPYQLSQ